jgi:hypothetical protein
MIPYTPLHLQRLRMPGTLPPAPLFAFQGLIQV